MGVIGFDAILHQHHPEAMNRKRLQMSAAAARSVRRAAISVFRSCSGECKVRKSRLIEVIGDRLNSLQTQAKRFAVRRHIRKAIAVVPIFVQVAHRSVARMGILCVFIAIILRQDVIADCLSQVEPQPA